MLRRILYVIRRDPRCAAVKDAIGHKQTVEFRFDELHVDLTWSPALDAHGPTVLTRWLQQRLAELPPAARRCLLLLLDLVKDTEACHSRSKGAVASRLKGVHWLLLGMAWWSHAAREAPEEAWRRAARGEGQPLPALLRHPRVRDGTRAPRA
ncbi:unnamed protein product, partial [Prorocentrum cordatum]